MAVDTKSLSELLTTLTDAVISATTAFPTEESSVLSSKDGISLLDVKNDLLLSYLQHLVFLILIKLRHHTAIKRGEVANDRTLGDEVIKKLIELRVYLERGVKPLEGRLRYQIDKVLRAAEDADRSAAQKEKDSKLVNGAGSKKERKKVSRHGTGSEVSNFESGSEGSISAESGDEIEEEDEDEENFRPNALALARAAAEKDKAAQQTQLRSKSGMGTTAMGNEAYKPPRITPTAMPTTETSSRSRLDREEQRRRKSHLLDEYVDTELSSAPVAQPSIGSNATILAQGRGGLSARDRARERERTEYEERNFTRLPAPSKKERKRQTREAGKRDMYGGEDWTGLGGMGDRISLSVSAGGKGGRDELGMLQRREKRKRERETTDGPRGDGMPRGMGESFEKRRKVLQGRMDRKATKRRSGVR